MSCKRTIVLTFLLICAAFSNADDLNKKKMESITKEILEVFVNDSYGEKSDYLRKYISEDWLERKRLDVKKYKINNYSPDQYEILYSGADICVATIGSTSWLHLVVFKFTEEWGKYYVVPRGISEASSDYIDPWFFVKDYICDKNDQ